MSRGLLLACLLTGCVTRPDALVPLDIGGSRADGTIIMGVQTDLPEWPVDWAGSEDLVYERCLAWGYTNYQGFSGVRRQVVSTDSVWFPLIGTMTANVFEISRTYQCTTQDAIQ